MGARTFYDAFAKDNTPEDIALYLEKSFSPEIQLAQLSDPGVLFLIVESDDAPLGYAKLNLNRDRNSEKNAKTLELERIYAERGHIGTGVGGTLMQACIDEARQRGCDSIWLGVWEKNQRAIEFYRKWGFKEIGKQIFTLGNDPQGDFIMELQLA